MTVTFTPAVTSRLADPDAESVRRNHDQRIGELQKSPLAGATVLRNKQLLDTVNTVIPHGLGRAPQCVTVSPPRGAIAAGIVRDVTDGSTPSLFAGADPAKVIVLRADGFNATITVDITVS